MIELSHQFAEKDKLICDDSTEVLATSDRRGHSSHGILLKSLCKNKYLLIAGVLASSGGVLFGYDIGVISGALVQLTALLNLSCLEQEIVTSSVVLGAFVMSLFGGVLIDFYGRKFMILISAIFYTVGAIITTAAFNYSTLVFGRLILGMAISLSSSAECVYVSEISPIKYRSTLVSLNELGISMGFLLAYCANAIFTFDSVNGWRWMFGSSIVIVIVMVVAILSLPKSPRYLVMKGMNDEAKSVLCLLRQVDFSSSSITEEWILMKSHAFETSPSFRATICKKSSWYALFIAFSLMIIQQMTGQPTLLFYVSTVLVSLGFSKIVMASVCSVALGFIKLISTIICICIIEKFERKYFLICGSIVMSVCLLLISASAITHDIGAIDSCAMASSINISSSIVNSTYAPITSTNVTALGSTYIIKWIILFSLIVFVSAYSFSFGPVSWLFLSELFPTSIRGKAFSLSISLNWSFQLLVTLTFLSFSDACGSIGWPYLLNAMFTFGSVAFMYKFLPETKGKSLEAIQTDIAQHTICFSCR